MSERSATARESTTRFRIEGMCCAEETTLLRAQIGPMLRDPESLRFDLLRGVMIVAEPLSEEKRKELLGRVERTGMSGELLDRQIEHDDPIDAHNHTSPRLLVSTIVAAVATSIGIGIEVSGVPGQTAELTVRSLLILASAIGLFTVFPKAIAAIRLRRPDMNLLMSVAVVGAIIIDEPIEAAVISTLFAFSLLLESWSIGRARRAVERLMERAPARARKIGEDGTESIVEPTVVAVGDRLLVRPGETFPVDGRVADGEGDVDAAAVTGESRPVAVTFGSPVYAGTISLDAPLQIIATRPATESTWSRIVRLVDEAGTRRSKSERWVEKFARVYTPIVFLTAILVAVVPPLLGLGPWSEWIYRGLVVLVIGCPCALVIATPVAVVSGLAAAARSGVLIKGGEYLELPGQLDLVALDKTGTLTTGELEVRSIMTIDDVSEDHVLATAASLERGSNHPLARGVVAAAGRRGVEVPEADEIRQIPGRGMIGKIDGREILVGSIRHLRDNTVDVSPIERLLEKSPANAGSLVLVAEGGRALGGVLLADEIRSEAKAALKSTITSGVRPVLISGDAPDSVAAAGATVGIDRVFGGVLPERKLEIIEQLSSDGSRIAMVGDGINDAPAMAASDLGIAMGIRGTDVALESADIVLMSDDLSRLPWLIEHSRRALRTIRTNIGLALGIKLAVFIATFFGLATLWAAILADIGATLLVSANALRLLRDSG